MATKIIMTGKHSERTMQRFQELPDAEILFVGNAREITPEAAAEAEILVGGVTPELVERMPKLRFVQLFSAGANNFAWLPKHITLANAYGAYGDSIAEHMLTTTLMAMKRMPEYLRMQERQGWELLNDIVRFEGSRILSVGMGAIGTAYLRRASALGAECYGVRRTIHDVPDFLQKLVTPEEMDELLPDMDVVALSLPGTKAVKGMFDERRLRLMKPGAILINVGRGNSVVTDDLLRVMADGHLRAACLDVMDPEPLPKDHPLWNAPRVYLTPHISGGYRAGVNYDRVMDVAVQNVKLVLSGQPPVHEVDRELGY
ncbi:MAG: D-2-hydroxyacid dehydrogenase [Oscillospiraceae bacterium]|nr:D-2-hydroxyacid dehydrogenase [Oscillospiraceae bacterium]